MVTEIKDKIDKLDASLKSARENHVLESEKEEQVEKEVTPIKYVTMIVSDLVAGTFVGSILGYYLDNFFDTKPLCFIVFMLLGMLGGFWNIFKQLK